MGVYSVAAHIVSKKKKALMLEFLNKEFTPHAKLFGCDTSYITQPSEKLRFDNSPRAIGFDFAYVGYESEYAITLCRWIALKLGTLRYNSMTGRKQHWYMHEGNNVVFIYEKDKYKLEIVGDVIDQLGMATYFNNRLSGYANECQLLTNEMLRLDTAWQEFSYGKI